MHYQEPDPEACTASTLKLRALVADCLPDLDHSSLVLLASLAERLTGRVLGPRPCELLAQSHAQVAGRLHGCKKW